MPETLRELRFEKVPDDVSWNKVRFLMKFVNLTMRELAKDSDVSLGTIQKVEQGNDDRVSTGLKKKVCAGLNRHLKSVFLHIGYDALYPAQMKGTDVHPRYDPVDPVAKIQVQAFSSKNQKTEIIKRVEFK